MSMQKDLEKALTRGHEVGLHRRIPHVEELRGIPVGLGRKWALLAFVYNGVMQNGYEAVRLADVASTRLVRQQEFTARALERHGGRLPPLDVPLDTTRGLVDGLADLFPLVGVHVEREDPDWLLVGRPVGWARKHLLLHEIDPGAVWRRTQVTAWRTAELTRVSVGDLYLEELALQAPERPVPRPVRWSRPRR